MPRPTFWSLPFRSGTDQPRAEGRSTASRRGSIPYRRTYILPTRFGLTFAFVLFALFLGAMNYNNNMVFFMVFLLAGLALFSMTRTHRNLVGLRIDRVDAMPVFAGEPIRIQLQLENTAPFTRLDLTLGTRRQGHLGAPLDLAPGERGSCWLDLPTEKRGRFECKSLVLVSRRPFGLFRAFHPLPVEIRSVIYPKPADPSRPLPVSSTHSNRSHARQTETHDFMGLRPYRDGDGRKRISWPTYAKGLGLWVKEFDRPTGQDIEMLRWVDAPGDLEERLSHLARWVVTLAGQPISYGLELPNGTIPAARGIPHRDRCLTCLALYPEHVP